MRTFAKKPKATQQTTSAKSTKPSRSFVGQSRDVSSILNLKRTVGNHAVLRMLQTETENIDNKTVSRANANQPFFQKKSGKETFFKPEGNENSFFSKDASFFSPLLSFNSIPNQMKKNESLPEDLQENMENSFGQDFTNVNIQKNSQEAVDLNARAFTKGDSVHFAPGEFNPNSEKGKNLVGHEFAHVTQQRSGVVKPTSVMGKGLILNDDKELEREADIFGEKAVNGELVPKYQSSRLAMRNNFSTIQTKSNIVQLDEYTEQDHASSVPHLMRILDEGNENNIRAALQGLRRAESSMSETDETSRVVFSSEQDSYNLTITSNEIDEFIRLYERYLSHEEQAGQATRVSADFVTEFNSHFSSILHVFRPRPASGSSAVISPEEASRGLSAQEIAANFTQGQITLLSQYLASRVIPERLFNGDETNLLDADQRIVISAHMLANGRYDPGFLLQGVHARMCFHWAHLVYHYAGVTPPSGPLTVGVMGTTDPTGQVVLGGGSVAARDQGAVIPDEVRRLAREGRLETARVAREAARAALVDPTREQREAEQRRTDALAAIRELQTEIQDASPQDRPALRRRLPAAQQRVRAATQERNEANRRLRSATGSLRRAEREHSRMVEIARVAVSRRVEISAADIRNLQRGDWLYIFTDVDTRTGDHSVIFSRWRTPLVVASGGRVYGQAELYSQGSPQRGGRAHTNWIGNFSGREAGHDVHGITRFMRMSSASNPADTADEILPPLPSGTLRSAEIENPRFIERHGLDRSAVMQRLAEQNRSLLDSLAWRITPNQRALLLTINQEDNLERRVQLNERLRNLSHNVATSETARASSVEIVRLRYEPRVTRRREAARQLLRGLTGRFDRVDERLRAFASAIGGRPNGVVPNSSALTAGLPTTLDADSYAEEIGFTAAAEAVVTLNRLLQRETVTPEQAEEESRLIDELGDLFSTLSANIPPPGIRRHLRNLLRSTQQNRNDIDPSSLPDFRRWRNACEEAHGPLDLAIRQLQNHALIPFARTMRQQGGALPYVTTHIGGRGERYSPTGLLSNVPNISNIPSE